MGGFKATISGSERKFLFFMAMLALLVGLAVEDNQSGIGSFAVGAIMIGLFGICLAAVKRSRV